MKLEIFLEQRRKRRCVCVCAEIVWRISLRNLDQTLISPSSKIGLSWNLVSTFYSCSSWIWRWDCQSEFPMVSSAAPNKAGQKTREKIPVLRRFHRRGISPWSVVRSSWDFVRTFFTRVSTILSVGLLIRTLCREIYTLNKASKFVLFYLLFHLLIFHIIGHDCYMDGIIKYIHAMMIVQWLIKFYGIIIISDEI